MRRPVDALKIVLARDIDGQTELVEGIRHADTVWIVTESEEIVIGPDAWKQAWTDLVARGFVEVSPNDQRKMAADTDRVLALVRRAFHGVTLGNGVGLHKVGDSTTTPTIAHWHPIVHKTRKMTGRRFQLPISWVVGNANRNSTPMTFYVVLPKFPWGDYGCVLVHGLAKRTGKHDSFATLVVDRTGPYVPPVSKPYDSCLVFSDAGKLSLTAHLEKAEFQPVELGASPRSNGTYGTFIRTNLNDTRPVANRKIISLEVEIRHLETPWGRYGNSCCHSELSMTSR